MYIIGVGSNNGKGLKMKNVRSEVMKKAYKHKAYSGCTFAESVKYGWSHTTRVNKAEKKAVETVELSIDDDFISGMGF